MAPSLDHDGGEFANAVISLVPGWRRRLEARLPGLGLERRTKVSARGVFTGMLAREAPAAWMRLGGLPTLSDAGIVSRARVESASQSLAELERLGAGRLWTLLTLEAWAQQRHERSGARRQR